VSDETGRKPRPIADLTLREFVAELGSAQPAPGCGAAAGVALSLAAACVAKAAAISLVHEPDASELRDARDESLRIARLALAGAEKDARAFEKVLKEDTARASRELVETDADLLAQCRSLDSWIDRISPQVRPNVSGDLSAARELVSAAERIHRLNLMELQDASAGAGEGSKSR
jgi:formiminotetrahydrofolate cyclodeaminase